METEPFEGFEPLGRKLSQALESTTPVFQSRIGSELRDYGLPDDILVCPESLSPRARQLGRMTGWRTACQGY